MRTTLFPIVLATLFLAACTPAPRQSVTHLDVTVEAPADLDVVTSPLIVSGIARGTWFFEGSFPIQLVDVRGNEIAVGVAQAQGEWMTESYVPFSATLEFQTDAEEGTVILKKDNPSGLPENDARVEVPVKFK